MGYSTGRITSWEFLRSKRRPKRLCVFRERRFGEGGFFLGRGASEWAKAKVYSKTFVRKTFCFWKVICNIAQTRRGSFFPLPYYLAYMPSRSFFRNNWTSNYRMIRLGQSVPSYPELGIVGRYVNVSPNYLFVGNERADLKWIVNALFDPPKTHYMNAPWL